MAKIKVAEFKRIVSAMKAPRALSRVGLVRGRRVSKKQRAIGKMLESVLSKAGLDVAKIDKMLAQDQSELRGLFKKQKAQAAKRFPAAEAAYRQGIAARVKALGLLATPFTSTFVTLDKAFLIWELPHPKLDIFIDQHVQSMNNYIQILIDTNNGSDSTQFVFYFLWENESDFFAIINASSPLTFNGYCEVAGGNGFFSGDTADLYIAASLTTMRWSGWGTDPVTGRSNDQTFYPYNGSQSQTVTTLHAEGEHLYGDPHCNSRIFSFEPINLGQDLIVVPGRAVAVFEVALQLSYGFDDGFDINDHVLVDFANSGNSIICPFVQLELLTAPPNMAVA